MKIKRMQKTLEYITLLPKPHTRPAYRLVPDKLTEQMAGCQRANLTTAICGGDHIWKVAFFCFLGKMVHIRIAHNSLEESKFMFRFASYEIYYDG